MNEIGYSPIFTPDLGQGSDQSLTDRLESSAESFINQLEVLIMSTFKTQEMLFKKGITDLKN